MLSVQRFEVASGTYHMDFYLTLRSDEPGDFGQIEFINSSSAIVDIYEDTPTVKVYRVRGTFAMVPDLRRFPFDEHDLTIIMENKTRTADQIEYVIDANRTQIDPDMVIVGWEVVPRSGTYAVTLSADNGRTQVQTNPWWAESIERRYLGFDEVYSRVIFQIHIKRPTLAAFIRTLLPALFIMLIAFCSLLLGPKELGQRLTITTAALTGLMLFHLNLLNAAPNLGYLTEADKFMLGNYATLVVMVATTVSLMVWTDNGRKHEPRRLMWILGVCIVIFWILGQAIVSRV